MKKSTKRFMRILTTIAFFGAAPFPLFATASIEFDSFWYQFNNADFRNYNAATYAANQSVPYLNTDDRVNLIFSAVRLKYNTKYKKTEFKLDMQRMGAWGTDNLQGRDLGQNPLTFRDVNFTWFPTEQVTIQFGRFTYGLGNTQKDYFIYDIIDGAQAEFRPNPNWKFHIMGDIFSNADKPDIAGYLAIVKKDPEQIDDFNGDTVTTRFGGYVQAYFAKVFSYMVRYGANSQGGADLSENGRNSLNKADGDFLTMSGVRFWKDSPKLGSGDLTVSYSYGKDYQFDDTHTYNDIAAVLNWQKKIEGDIVRNTPNLSAGYFGTNYASMKAQSMGSMLLWSYKSYFAAPYAYFYTIQDYGKRKDQVTYTDRTNSKTFLKIGDTIQLRKYIPRLSASPTVLFLFQTSGFIYMGTEIDLVINYHVDNLKFSLNPAIFIPTSYYPNQAATNTYIPNGTDPFYGMGFNVTYILDLDYISAQKAEIEDEVEDKSEDLLDDDSSGGFTVD